MIAVAAATVRAASSAAMAIVDSFCKCTALSGSNSGRDITRHTVLSSVTTTFRLQQTNSTILGVFNLHEFTFRKFGITRGKKT